MKQLVDKYDKKNIANLPRAMFEGRIITIISESDAAKAVDYLLAQPILGVDTETKPTFKRGYTRKVALLQVSTCDTCFLFRLNHIDLPDCLVRLLEDTTVPKIGLSIHDDIHVMMQRREFRPGLFIEVQNEVKQLGVQDMSLQKIYANVFGQKIAKNQQLSNWEADSLSPAQQQYAATDAWACIQIYEEVQRLKRTGDYTLVITPSQPSPTGEGAE